MSHKLSRDFCHPKKGQRFFIDEEEYILGEEIGNGAMGIVSEATRRNNNVIRAIKFLAPEPKYFEEGAFNDISIRFKREGERGSKLRHSNLVTIYNYCENDNGIFFDSKEPKNPFLVMERIDGEPLENYIKNFPQENRRKFLVTKQKLNIAIQITNALLELHRKKIVHRDVKPANIFIGKTNSKDKVPIVKLGDFGIVKWGDFQNSFASGSLTVTNQKGLGTMKYMPLEQASHPKDVDVKSDIYSLGITFFELFTGQILPTLHHVYEVRDARLLKGKALSRFYSMGYNIKSEDESIAALILDMHLKASGRPRTEKVFGTLVSIYENHFRSNWENDIDW